MSTYLDKILKEFKMDQSKKEFLPVLQGVKSSKTQNLTTTKDRERMKVIPYASAIGSMKYAMLYTRPIVYLAMSLARGYDSDPGVDHWTAVKVILSYLRGLRKYFSVMEVTKSLSYRVTSMQAFTPIQMTLHLLWIHIESGSN